MIYLKNSSVLILLCFILISCVEQSRASFLDALKDTITHGAKTISAAVGLPQMNPLRIFEQPPKEKAPLVKIPMGKIQGNAEFSRSKHVFFSYLGIPYAKSPKGNLRFEPPKPYDEEWDNVREAKYFQSACLQFDMVMAGGVTGSEDCLYLNVFTKDTKPETPLPVIVHLHGGYGGSLMSGASKDYHPRYFMDFPVVFVTLQYRLGALGFLNTGDGVIKGNMGLKDQRMAMQWVKDNIKAFGGDASKITLMGDGLGAISAHYHVLSDSSKDLFQRAIMQSGHALMPLAFTHNVSEQYKKFAELFDCPEDTKKWAHCMKKMDAVEIAHMHAVTESPITPVYEIFSPSAELAEEGAFLTQNPYDILEAGKYQQIPMIFGVNKAEGGYTAARVDAHDEIQKTLDISWATYVPIMAHYNSDLSNVSKQLKSHYLKKEIDLEENLSPIVHMLSDLNYFYPTQVVLDYHRKKNPDVYLYWYSYQRTSSVYTAVKSYKKDNLIKGKLSVVSSFANDFVSKAIGVKSPSDAWGPIAGDQIIMQFFHSTPTEIIKGSADYDVSREFVKSLTGFARGVKPQQFSETEWPPLKHEGTIQAMNIASVSDVKDDPFKNAVAFIETIHIRDPPSKSADNYFAF